MIRRASGNSDRMADSFNVVAMNNRRPFPALYILQRPSQVLQPSLIEEIEIAVRADRCELTREPNRSETECSCIRIRIHKIHPNYLFRARLSSAENRTSDNRLPTFQKKHQPTRSASTHLPSWCFTAATTWSGSNPYFLCNSLSGAEAPKVFMPMT